MKYIYSVITLFLITQQLLTAQISDRIYNCIQTLKTTQFHKKMEYSKASMEASVIQFKQHLEVYPISDEDSVLVQIKANYEQVRKQYNFALERLKMDLCNPLLMKKFIRHPNRESKQYLGEINQTYSNYRFSVQQLMDEKTEGAYSSFPIFEAVIGAWTIYQAIDKIVRHFVGLSREWKQQYSKAAPTLLETYYFEELRLPTWEEVYF